ARLRVDQRLELARAGRGPWTAGSEPKAFSVRCAFKQDVTHAKGLMGGQRAPTVFFPDCLRAIARFGEGWI
ncbi:MAG TPA: hypothetical protein VMI47_06830, partial [Pseudolabrys sp.]|nr:hypothetical protein [Pseudolabrys sp.]